MYHQLIDLFTTFKLWVLKILALFWIWFEPAKEMSTLLIVLILVDAVTDVWVKIEAKEKVNIKEFLKKQIKDITLFLLYILVIHYFQSAYLKEDLAIFKVMVGIPLIAVLSGVIENIEKLTGISVATKAKELLASVFGKLSDKVTKKDE